jgi:DNA polymerase III subunit delta'
VTATLRPDEGRTDGTAAAEGGVFRTRGHAAALAAARRMLDRGLPHAIVIGGPPGVGKTTLALDLAAALLCDDPDPRARPCRACRACRLVERERHPDVHRLAPAGPGDQIRIGTRDRPEDGTVRRLAADLVLQPVEGGARVALIERADRLTDDAQTALLKTLEEPPAGVVILLCADDEDRLMPTVRSRAARIRLGAVPTRDIEALLAEAGAADAPTAARLAHLSGGRPGAALQLAWAPEAVAAREEIARLLLDLLGAGPSTRLAAIRDLLARAGEHNRALDRAARQTPANADGVGGASVAGSRRARRGPSAAVPGPAPTDVSTAAGDGDATEDEAGGDEPAGNSATVPSATAAERRRTAMTIVTLWRELARDLAVTALGEERRLRDPALLDELRAASASLGTSTAAAAMSRFLGRLDAAGELLEANVRPELVLDSLVLAWPRATRP